MMTIFMRRIKIKMMIWRILKPVAAVKSNIPTATPPPQEHKMQHLPIAVSPAVVGVKLPITPEPFHLYLVACVKKFVGKVHLFYIPSKYQDFKLFVFQEGSCIGLLWNEQFIMQKLCREENYCR